MLITCREIAPKVKSGIKALWSDRSGVKLQAASYKRLDIKIIVG
jgi:hypothetical protein